MVNNEVKEQLASIVRQHGQSIAEDAPRLQGLLKDLVGQYRREINILMQAARANVPGELQRASGPTMITAERLSTRLQEETGLAMDAAQWAVSTWGNAMGIPVEFGEPEPEAVVPPPVTTVPDAPQRPATTEPVVSASVSTPPVSTPPAAVPPPISQPNPYSAPHTSFPPQPFAPAKKGMSGGVIAAVSVVVVAAVGGIFFVVSRKGNDGPGPTPGPSVSISASNLPSGSPSASASTEPSLSPSESNSPTASPTGGAGTFEDGVFNDGFGLFSFTPPEGWGMSNSSSDGSIQWSNTKNPELKAAMDLREVTNGSGKDLPELVTATEEKLKTDMKFVVKSDQDFKLGGEPAKLIYGSITTGGVAQEMAMVMAIKNGKVIIITMGAVEGKFSEVSGPLDTSLATWKWK